MEAIAAGRPPAIFGDGTQTMDFVNVADIARANMLAAASDVSDAVLNVGSGNETSLNELADMLLKVMGSPLRPEHKAERRVNPVPRRLAAVDAAAAQLGFRTRVTLEQGLRGLVEWWQRERAGAGER